MHSEGAFTELAAVGDGHPGRLGVKSAVCGQGGKGAADHLAGAAYRGGQVRQVRQVDRVSGAVLYGGESEQVVAVTWRPAASSMKVHIRSAATVEDGEGRPVAMGHVGLVFDSAASAKDSPFGTSWCWRGDLLPALRRLSASTLVTLSGSFR